MLVLTVELIPSTCFFVNCRSVLSKNEWDQVRMQVYSEANNKCEICKETPWGSLEAHEIFDYDDAKKVQKLVSIAALCSSCHRCKHPGLAKLQNKYDKMIKHFCKINSLSLVDAEKEIEKAFITWNNRSQFSWKLDISYLENYGFTIEELNRRIE